MFFLHFTQRGFHKAPWTWSMVATTPRRQQRGLRSLGRSRCVLAGRREKTATAGWFLKRGVGIAELRIDGDDAAQTMFGLG